MVPEFSIRDYTEKAVRKYIRTVLLVDDKLFNSQSDIQSKLQKADFSDLFPIPDTSDSGADSPSNRVSQNLEDMLGKSSLNSPITPEPFSPIAVMEGFAKQGIVCSLYQPDTSAFTNESIPKQVIELCDRSDVFILDWHLKDDSAKSPVPAILQELRKRDEEVGTPNPIRFCSIYTDQSLDNVFQALQAELNPNLQMQPSNNPEDTRVVRMGGLTIRLYSRSDPAEVHEEQSYLVSSADLAERIVQDFASEYEGIMSATALRGIAEVRDNAKRILEKFPKGMDAALVLHAGLTLNEKSIVSDLAALLGDEMSSILADMNLPSDYLYDMCAEYVESCDDSIFDKTGEQNLDGAFLEDVTGDSVKQYIASVFRQKTYFPTRNNNLIVPVFRKCNVAKREFSPNINLLRLFKRFVEKKIEKTSDYDFGALSALFCQRTIYSKQKTLRFGTVVRKCSTDGTPSQGYYLCLMPSCDSIRLRDAVLDATGTEKPVPHKFPFWELDVVREEGESKTHGLCVKIDGKHRLFCVKGKIRDKIHIMDFHSHGGVVRFDETGTLICVDGARKFEWIAELKSAHMQRIAERVGREFSRVGLTESEWLRKQVD